MRWGKLTAVVLVTLLVWGCGSGDDDNGVQVVVVVTPAAVTIAFGASVQFSAFVQGTTNSEVKWFVNDVEGGNEALGLITTAGLYTAPNAVPSPNPVTIKATSAEDTTASGTAEVTIESGIRVQVAPINPVVGTEETLQFTAIVTGTTTPTVTWQVNDVDGGSAALGTISDTGLYTAPAAVPSPAVVTIRATSTEDPARSGQTGLTVVAAADPELESLSPTSLALGALVQDLFLTGENFLSTNIVRVNGIPVSSDRVRLITRDLLRVRLPSSLVSIPGAHSVDVVSQGGVESDMLSFDILPARPALVGFSPDSAPEGGAALDIEVSGGYFGTDATPTVVAEYNGEVRAATIVDARRLRVTIGVGDLMQAGLFPLALRNTAAAAQLAAVNLAVQPSMVPSPVGNVAVGARPVAVAINTATGVAVVVNQDANSATLLDLSTLATATVPVGAVPSGVAVDNERNLAIVVNSGGKTISVINLATGTVSATVPVPPFDAESDAPTPHAVGINPLSGLALVAHRSTNFASVFDLDAGAFIGVVGGTEQVTVSTGAQPAVAVEPRLNWAIVTPGGAGALTIVDLGRQHVIATVTVGTTVRGIGLNTENARAVLTNPTTANVSLLSLLDQTVVNLPLEFGHVAAAVNPLTDIAVTVNPMTDLVSVIDLRTPARIATVAAGMDPRAVAIDPGTNTAVVVNEASNNVTLINLGAIRPLHVTQVSPATTFTSDADITLSVVGHGFAGDSVVRLDEMPLATTVVSSRRLEATMPAALLAGPRRFALDVLNAGNVRSNVAEFAVLQIVAVGTAPRAVAIDAHRNIALVVNNGSNNVSVIDLATGEVTETFDTATSPQAVAILSRAGRALVTNRQSNNTTIIDLDANEVTGTLFTDAQPIGVTMDEETGLAVVVANASNSFSIVDPIAEVVRTSANTDLGPVAAAFDPGRNLVAVANAGQNTITIFQLSPGAGETPQLIQRITAFQLPTAVLFDPVADRFIVVSSLTNNIGLINPATFQISQTRVGINPTSAALNVNTGALMTVNSASRTISVMDFVARRVRAVYSLDGSLRFSVAIHPITNLAVVADEANDRVVLFPLPR
jgi:YVTN family beta-propeller protein